MTTAQPYSVAIVVLEGVTYAIKFIPDTLVHNFTPVTEDIPGDTWGRFRIRPGWETAAGHRFNVAGTVVDMVKFDGDPDQFFASRQPLPASQQNALEQGRREIEQ